MPWLSTTVNWQSSDLQHDSFNAHFAGPRGSSVEIHGGRLGLRVQGFRLRVWGLDWGLRITASS